MIKYGGRIIVACKVLVVDDDQRTREALAYILQRAGYEVLSLASGDGMEELLERNHFAAAIIDYHLPHRNGLEIAQSLRHHVPSCRIILISSEYQHRPQTLSPPAVVDRFLAKPFSKTALLKTMVELCPLGTSLPG
jgi:DNA-binding response OmpR family regulator